MDFSWKIPDDLRINIAATINVHQNKIIDILKFKPNLFIFLLELVNIFLSDEKYEIGSSDPSGGCDDDVEDDPFRFICCWFLEDGPRP